ncbi:VWA domain-containing protein [Mycobacterium sp. DBP42]|uniref:vWA domain-containing protein n=1 Tax=Mycobacterium sp. DBP42 TaxID=2545267 RepID=UPI00110CBEEF|nr:VWA domain-containing protein [Mycobacterium sp. DBP42]TMS50862.1 VWA domain-containing protein [Mycobacterium sp. DBP42]
MKLSVAPAFPIWLIVALALVAIVLRIMATVASARRDHGMPSRTAWLQLSAAVMAIVCVAVAATRIGDESKAEPPPRLTTTAEESNTNVFLVLDRSLGMGANDFGSSTAMGAKQTRLKGASTDAQAVLSKYPDARFSVISYADTAQVEWPISPDEWSLVPFLQNFYGERSTDRVAETDVAASNSLLREQLSAASHAYPGSANLVFIFGAGSDSDDSAFDIPLGQVSGGAVFGYNTDVPLNEEALTAAAHSLGIPFIKRENGMLDVEELPSAMPQATTADPVNPNLPHPGRTEYYWLFTAIAGVLFGVEFYGLAGNWLRRRRGTAGK